MKWKIPLSDLDLGSEEEEAVLRVIRSQWLTMGAETQAFESEFAESIGAKHAVAVSNGTASLHLAMLALDIGAGDAVIQPAVNFVATANMTIAVGATPVFADICSLEEPTICPKSLSKLLTDDHSPMTQRPVAVVVMHYGGYPSRMEKIADICREHNLALIEDACHGVGGSCGNIKMGAWGDAGCFSFFSNKNLVTGEGGMVTTNRDDVAEKVRLLRSHGMTTLTWDRHKGHAATYDVITHGYNCRSDEIRSAIGSVQLKKLDGNNLKRRELTHLYWEKLAPLEDNGWIFPFNKKTSSSFELSSLNESSCHLLAAVAPSTDVRWHCAEALKAAGVQTSLHYPYIPEFSVFVENDQATKSEIANDFCKRVITLPLYPTMSREDVEFVSRQLITGAYSKAAST